MSGWTDIQTDRHAGTKGRKGRWIDRHKYADRWINILVARRADRQIDRQIDIHMDKQTDWGGINN